MRKGLFQTGSLIVEFLVAMMVFSVALATTFGSVFYMVRSLHDLRVRQERVEAFEYVIFYLSSQFEKAKDFRILKGRNWSVIFMDTSPILAFEIFTSKRYALMRRLVGSEKLKFEKLKNLKVGLSFFNGHNFSGFNVVFKSVGKMYFKRAGKHLLFVWNERWVYLM